MHTTVLVRKQFMAFTSTKKTKNAAPALLTVMG